MNYIYTAYAVNDFDKKEALPDTDTEYFNIGFDVISGNNGHSADPWWKYESAKQETLNIFLAGKDVTPGRQKSDGQPADPFGESNYETKIYEYTILDVQLIRRQSEWTYPQSKKLSVWGKIGRFFGGGVWDINEPGRQRLVFVDSEWGWYGKKGTLRQIFGEFITWPWWGLAGIIALSVFVGISVLYGLFHLYLWLVQQRQLAKWNGMEDVWNNIRRASVEEEEDGLLGAEYRDDPGEGRSSSSHHYTDEPSSSMKPLPSKPLPEKPLPDVPLIDA